MLNLVLGGVVLMASACQVETPGGEAKTTIRGGKEPLHAEFLLRHHQGGEGNELAHVLVKITFKDGKPNKMYVKDLLSGAESNPVEELDVTKTYGNPVSQFYAGRGNQRYTFTYMSDDHSGDDDPRYKLILSNNELMLTGKSTESFNGNGKCTEKYWDEKTGNKPSASSTPLTEDEQRYFNSNCLNVLDKSRMGLTFEGNNGCTLIVRGLKNPDVVRYLIKHQLQCIRTAEGHFALADSSREILTMSLGDETLDMIVNCKTPNRGRWVYLDMEDGNLLIKKNRRDIPPYTVQAPE